MNKKASKELKDRAVELYNSGISATDVAKEIGYNEATIRNWLKLRGISIRNGGFYNVKYS